MSESDDIPTSQWHPNINPDTVASNPGRIRLQWSQYWRCYPIAPVIFAALLIPPIWFALVPLFSQVRDPNAYYGTGGIGVAVVLFFAWSILRLPSATMVEGDTCAAVVLDPESGWIAVYADMTSNARLHFVPAIKVLRVPPLKRAVATPLKAGDRLTAVCLYEPNSWEGNPVHWSDLRPIAVVCATRKQTDIERSLASVPEGQWRLLETNLGLVPQPYCTGLHFIET